jgi:holo-[acyl-carrier protein] synthase
MTELSPPRLSVGLDLIEIERVEQALSRHPVRFRERCFTLREIEELDRKPRPSESYAGRFAAKEAIGKALGTGVHFTWTEIEVAGRGKPTVTLTGWTREVAQTKGVIAIDVSITHSRTTSAAVAIAVLGPEESA